MKTLITGGAGYIGSTIASILIDNGHEPVILDSLANGREEFVSGRIFYKGDIADKDLLEKIFEEHPDIESVIHCAAFLVVPESEEKPYEYYKNNVAKSLELFKNLKDQGCQKIIFSSSASVYGKTSKQEVTEESPLDPGSPYARTKYMMEMVLSDLCTAYSMRGIALRYFNPIGADPKMRTGLPAKTPTQVLGKMVSVSKGEEDVFNITGVDWPTRDGSGIRDYIHVWDLARAHLLAVENFDQAFEKAKGDYLAVNLGTGQGVTVKELVQAFENVLGKSINKKEAPPRPGDVAGAYASCQKAQDLFGWKAELSIEQGIADALKWADERKNVLGF
ncbi:UDP-glucose 4-epimerase GalE [Candidatus Falkowbacteria bacterium]|nr:UDP-glucose 4-epimerase GalE [Candidatus Falkowbacteria bacterium]